LTQLIQEEEDYLGGEGGSNQKKTLIRKGGKKKTTDGMSGGTRSSAQSLESSPTKKKFYTRGVAVFTSPGGRPRKLLWESKHEDLGRVAGGSTPGKKEVFFRGVGNSRRVEGGGFYGSVSNKSGCASGEVLTRAKKRKGQTVTISISRVSLRGNTKRSVLGISSYENLR